MELRELKNTGVVINTEAELDEILSIRDKAGLSTKLTMSAGGCRRKIKSGISMYIVATHKDMSMGILPKNEFSRDLITLQQFKERQGIMKYKEGDVLVSVTDGVRKVLGVCGSVYFLSAICKFDLYAVTITERVIIADGYTLKTDEPELVEKTVGEMEKELGMDAGTLRIKD